MDQSEIVRVALASWFESNPALPISESCILHAFDRTVEATSDDYRSLLEDFRVGFPDIH